MGVRDADGHPLAGFTDALYLSGVTVSTVAGTGTCGLPPTCGWRPSPRAGLILFGYFVAVLGNRLRH